MILKSLVSENVIVWTEFTSVSSTDMFDCVKYSEIQELREYIQIQLPRQLSRENSPLLPKKTNFAQSTQKI